MSIFARRLRTVFLSAALAFGSLCLSGCGGGDDDGENQWNGGNGSSGSSGGGGGGGSLGNSLSLSGQVYKQEMNLDGKSGELIKYVAYSGSNVTFSSNVGGSGSIKSGKMSFSAGVPSADLMEPCDAGGIPVDDDGVYSDMKCSDNNALGVGLDFDIRLLKGNISMNSTSGSFTIEEVMYAYIDRDCKITATGKTVTEDGVKITYPNLNISFKKGWNALYVKIAASQSGGSLVFSTGDKSSCKWVYGNSYDDYDYLSKSAAGGAAAVGIIPSLRGFFKR